MEAQSSIRTLKFLQTLVQTSVFIAVLRSILPNASPIKLNTAVGLCCAATPIISLTALAMPGDMERCLNAGASKYMSKPVCLKNLLHLIAQLTKERSKEHSASIED